VTGNEPPIIVLVHGEPQRAFDAQGQPNNRLAQSMIGLIDNWRIKRYDVLEWASALEDAPPSLTEFNETGARPVVWFVPGPPSRFVQAAGGPGAREERLESLGSAVAQLLERGENLIVTTGLSTRPAVGGDDPLATPLADLGLNVRVGTPIIERDRQPGGVVAFNLHHDVAPIRAGGDSSGRGAAGVDADATDRTDADDPAAFTRGVDPNGPGAAIARTVRGLRTVFHWPTPIEFDAALAESRGVAITPLLRVTGDTDTWAESRWLSTRLRTPGAAARLGVLRTPRPPEPNPARDDLDGPWMVAAAAERANPDARGSTNRRGTQRIVAVGAAEWFQDAFNLLAEQVDGRLAYTLPGNAEFVDAAVSWAAHRDELIAPSPRTQDIARLSPELAPETIAGLRWTLGLGVPFGVLVVGALVLLGRR
jgi:hypothetical protein